MKTAIKISDLEKSKVLFCLPEDIFIDILVADTETFSIDNSILEAAKKEQNYRNGLRNVLNEIASLNNNGIKYEKSGKIEEACIEYENCMKIMYYGIKNKILKNFAWHSPARLRILYKKGKHLREKEFLNEFINFCNYHRITCPEAFQKQLDKFQQ